MKRTIRHWSVVSLFALTSFTFSNVVQPTSAHAIAGSITGIFPLVIAGATLAGVGVTSAFIGSLMKPSNCAAGFVGFGAVMFGLGGIFLDETSGLNAQMIDSDSASKYHLTEAERQAYNQAVEEGQINMIIDHATQTLASYSNPTLDDAKAVMDNLLSNLPDDARTGFIKISKSLVKAM